MNRPEIFVINLQRRPERLESFKKDLNKCNITSFNLIIANDGNELSNEDAKKNLSPKNNWNYPWGLNKYQISCTLSHRQIYNHIIENNLDYALVFEDDVSFSSDLFDFIENINEDSVKDILALGHYKPNPLSDYTNYNFNETHFSNKLNILNDLFIYEYDHVNNGTVVAWGTHAYIISKSGAQKMLEITQQQDCPLDGYWTYHSEKLHTGFVFPPVADLKGLQSDTYVIVDNQEQGRVT